FSDFLDYYEKVRARTMKVVKCIPADKIEWRIKEGMFSLGDLVRHLGAIERHMYAENAQRKPSRYHGCGEELAKGCEDVVLFFESTHKESMEIFRSLSEEDANKKCVTPGGAEITIWKWLRLMGEHEIHHRGQLYTCLAVLGVPTPPMYGLTSEQVIERSE
ncbi:MAG: DinB family protein, partial [Cyclobacteriaceae bacterium]